MPSTSGTTSFFLEIADIIDDAMDMLGGEPVLGDEPVSARRSLNLLFIDLQNRGIPLFAQDAQTLSLVADDKDYTLDADTVDILEGMLRRTDGALVTDLQMHRISMEEYIQLPNKEQSGRPSQFALDRQKTPVLYVWPVPESGTTDIFYYWRVRKLEDINASFQNPDIIYRYLPALTSGLAYYMGIKRPAIDFQRIQLLKADYEEKLQRAFESDTERVSMKIVPRLRVI
jgi:hypothetical protein